MNEPHPFFGFVYDGPEPDMVSWRAYSNGGRFGVCRDGREGMEVLSDRRGRYVRFRTFEAAKRRAARLNAGVSP